MMADWIPFHTPSKYGRGQSGARAGLTFVIHVTQKRQHGYDTSNMQMATVQTAGARMVDIIIQVAITSVAHGVVAS
jgi:hypothetical protein